MATFTHYIDTSGDDGYSGGAGFDLDDAYVECMTTGTGPGLTHGGWIFDLSGEGISQGDTVNTAYLGTYSHTSPAYDHPWGDLYCADEDNRSSWSDSSGNRPSDVTVTTASVPWDEDDIAHDQYVESPDIASIIQEVIDRGGWGGHVAVVMRTEDTATAGFWFSSAVDRGVGYEPYLEVDYTAGGGPPSPKPWWYWDMRTRRRVA